MGLLNLPIQEQDARFDAQRKAAVRSMRRRVRVSHALKPALNRGIRLDQGSMSKLIRRPRMAQKLLITYAKSVHQASER